MSVQFGGKFVYPDLETALKAHHVRLKVTEEEFYAHTPRIPLPGLKLNRALNANDKPYIHLLQVEDKFAKQYPGVVVLTNDKAGEHMSEIPRDMQIVYATSLIGPAMNRVLNDKESPADWSNYQKLLAALWDPEQLKTGAEIKQLQHRRVQDAALRLRDTIEKRQEEFRVAEEKKQNRLHRRAWRWIKSWF